MSQICNACEKPISWNPKKVEELGIKGPLNPDLTIHKCYSTMKITQVVKDEVPPRPPGFTEDKPTEIALLTKSIERLAAAGSKK